MKLIYSHKFVVLQRAVNK